ncbi:MAG: ester cyclase [Halovenus sp.]
MHDPPKATPNRWSATGTQESDLFGMDPTGEMFSAEGISVFAVEDGEITEVHAQWDTLQMVQDLGVVPPVGLAADSSTSERDGNV